MNPPLYIRVNILGFLR